VIEVKYNAYIKKQGNSFYIRVPAGLARSLELAKEYVVRLEERPTIIKDDKTDPILNSFKPGDEV